MKNLLSRLLGQQKNPLRDYILKEEIGHGGMSKIYHAKHKYLPHEFAVKILLPQFAEKREKLENLLKDKQVEGEIACSLRHPNIIRTHDYGKDSKGYYFIMEYVDGYNLDELIEQNNSFLEGRRYDIIMQICRGMKYIHDMEIIHRDICPRNMLITKKGEVKIIDFGLSISKRGRHRGLGERAGTPSYMAPEQVRAHTVDERTDIYSLGVTLYKVLTGRTPFQSDDTLGRLHQHLNVTPVSPCRYNPDISEGMESIIMRAMEKEPEKRYQSMKEVINDLLMLKELSGEQK